MRVLFCSEPFAPSRVDAAYEREFAAARAANLSVELIDFEALARGESASAVRRIKTSDVEETIVYRGWMLKPDVYAKFFAALEAKNLILINSPEAYKHCHYLPESLPMIKDHTPATVTVKLDGDFDLEQIMSMLAPFGDKPLVVKDYVKSRKHEWAEACFIRSASDKRVVEQTVKRFVELQGEDLNQGLVFREFVEFQSVGAHPKSGMPLTKEFRLIFLDGELLDASAYWDEGDYSGEPLPEGLFGAIARQVESRFFTMDVAQRADGEWMIVELGDAQVAGLPDNADAAKFYRSLGARLLARG